MKLLSREELGQIEQPGVMLLPTDTVYGLHARVDDSDAVVALQTIKERDDVRYFITLISDWEHLDRCGVVVQDRHRVMLEKLRPGPHTVLLRDHEGLTHSFRWPDKAALLQLINQQGPLYSTSANWHGKPTIASFNDLDEKLDFLIDYGVNEGVVAGSSSTIIEIVR